MPVPAAEVGAGVAECNEVLCESCGTCVSACPTGAAQLLTPGDYDEFSPAWSPDGSRIAFTSNRQEGYDTWVMAGDGGEQTLLLTTSAWDDYPRWAPDGERLA